MWTLQEINYISVLVVTRFQRDENYRERGGFDSMPAEVVQQRTDQWIHYANKSATISESYKFTF